MNDFEGLRDGGCPGLLSATMIGLGEAGALLSAFSSHPCTPATLRALVLSFALLLLLDSSAERLLERPLKTVSDIGHCTDNRCSVQSFRPGDRGLDRVDDWMPGTVMVLLNRGRISRRWCIPRVVTVTISSIRPRIPFVLTYSAPYQPICGVRQGRQASMSRLRS